MPDEIRRELEAALAASWTRANLAVYGDHLQSIDDPRGEWIAMDLALLRDGAKAATQEQRARLLARYRAERFEHSRFAYGFVEELVVHRGLRDELGGRTSPGAILRELFASPVGPFVKTIWIDTAQKDPGDFLSAIAAAPRPWLRRISVARLGSGSLKPVNEALAARLVAATPHLEVLELGDHGMRPAFQALAHPRLKDLVVGVTAHRFSTLELEVPGHASDAIELGRIGRLHAGTVDDMPGEAREAWAELRFAIEQLEDGHGGAAAGRPFPAALLRAVLASIDLTSYYGRDWAGTAAKLGDADAILRGRR